MFEDGSVPQIVAGSVMGCGLGNLLARHFARAIAIASGGILGIVLGIAIAIVSDIDFGIVIGVGIGIGISSPRGRRKAEMALPTTARKAEPPSAAQYVLELLAPAEWDEAAAGDFLERYERKFRRVAGKHGVSLAKVDYWWQVLRSAPGLLRIRFRDLAALAAAVKVLDVLQKYWTAK